MYQFIYFCWDKCWTMMILFFSPGILTHIVNDHFWFSYHYFESSVTGNKPTQDFLVIFPTGRFIDQIAVVVVLDFMQLFLHQLMLMVNITVMLWRFRRGPGGPNLQVCVCLSRALMFWQKGYKDALHHSKVNSTDLWNWCHTRANNWLVNKKESDIGSP